jgi:hypothetical protein
MRADYWRSEARTWDGVGRRLRLALLISIGTLVLTCVAVILLGGSTSTSDARTIALIAVVFVLGGFAFAMRRPWRPAVSTSFAAVVVGFAWFASVLADFSTPADTDTTFAFVCAAFGLAAAYALVFRPLGDEIRKVEDSNVTRAIIRSELERVLVCSKCGTRAICPTADQESRSLPSSHVSERPA